MRWYKIQAGGLTFDATGDPNALNVELDLPISTEAIPKSGAFARVWGIDLPTLLNAKILNNQPIKVYGGMQPGLPLANPAEQGLLVQGTIFPAFGNWVGVDMTLDLTIRGPFGTPNNYKPANVIHNWPQNTPLSSSIQNTLSRAFPQYTPQINISPNLKLNYNDWGFYETIGQYATYIQNISRTIMGGVKNYLGVRMAAQGSKIVVFDGTQSSGAKQISYTDLIGQPVWTGINTIQFKCVMRGDININDMVTMPPTLATLTASSGTAVGGAASNLIQGTFRVMQIRHTGNFRQPDWPSWCSTFDAVQP